MQHAIWNWKLFEIKARFTLEKGNCLVNVFNIFHYWRRDKNKMRGCKNKEKLTFCSQFVKDCGFTLIRFSKIN